MMSNESECRSFPKELNLEPQTHTKEHVEPLSKAEGTPEPEPPATAYRFTLKPEPEPPLRERDLRCSSFKVKGQKGRVHSDLWVASFALGGCNLVATIVRFKVQALLSAVGNGR